MDFGSDCCGYSRLPKDQQHYLTKKYYPDEIQDDVKNLYDKLYSNCRPYAREYLNMTPKGMEIIIPCLCLTCYCSDDCDCGYLSRPCRCFEKPCSRHYWIGTEYNEAINFMTKHNICLIN